MDCGGEIVSTLLVALLVVPFVAVGVCLIAPPTAGRILTAGVGVGSFGAVLALVTATRAHSVAAAGFLRIDALSTIFLLATALVYATVSLYTVGYLRAEHVDRRYCRRILAGINLFAWALLAAPMVNGFTLLWVAVELTTVISALLVAIDDTDAATEAAWKYVLIASAGLGLALFGTVFYYYAGSQVLGTSYTFTFDALTMHAAGLPHTAVRLGFVLAVLGFGTKVGFFPVHTWLPDAHSEAPTPVSALLSGSLLAVSFYAILRFYQVAVATLGAAFPRQVLLAFGIASLALAALYLLDQRDIKRLLAYSSIEHMGILAVGMSFGARIAVVGVLLHVLAHAAAKGNAFMGAGVFVRAFGTKDLTAMRRGFTVLPWSAPLFLLAILALAAAPPFGIFRSEFYIVAGGLAAGHSGTVAVLVALVILAFAGLTWTTTALVFPADEAGITTASASLSSAAADGRTSDESIAKTPDRPTPRLGREFSAWLVIPPVLGLAVLVLLGMHPPASLIDLLTRGAVELGGG